MHNAALHMTGPTPIAVRIQDREGTVLGDYDFLGWTGWAGFTCPVVLYQGADQPIGEVVRVLDGEAYTLVFVEGSILNLEGRLLDDVRD